MAEWDLPLIWAGIIGFSVAMYVIMDGFDLGIGMLFPFAQGEGDRDQMMASIKPYWDGNETWLVLGGGGLLAVFPLAYSIILPALYLPVIFMLLALIFRGVAFEFRGLSENKRGWNFAFASGSLVATLSQGIVLGGFVQGFHVENGAFSGGALDWLTPFPLLCGLGIVAGYALLGATWLVMKTSGELARRSRNQAVVLIFIVLGFMAAVSLWTPLAYPQIAERWFSLPNIFYLWPVPATTAFCAYACWRSLQREHDWHPFVAAIGIFLTGYLGLAISIFPYLVPPALTIWQSAGSPQSQIFMLTGTLVMVPVVVGYTVFVYWLFRGKVREGETYH